MLQVEALTKRFGNVTALDGVSFSIGEGEIVGLLGENGAGKTTTLRLLAGALFPSSGRVVISGRDLYADFLSVKRLVGYLPERLPLDNRMRVQPFLDYVARLRGLNRRERPNAVARVLEACQLTAVARRGIGTLSRGVRMRVGLAQALVHNPELVLLDEPTAGLDPQQVLNMRELILSLSGHHTILFSSHNLTEVSECCSRIVLLREGRVVAEDALASLKSRHGEQETLYMRFTRPPENLPAVLTSMDDVTGVERPVSEDRSAVLVRVRAAAGVRERLSAEVSGRGWGLREFREASDSLEDLFRQPSSATPATDPPPAARSVADPEPTAQVEP